MNNHKCEYMLNRFINVKNDILNFINNNSSHFSKQDFRSHYYLLRELDVIIEQLSGHEISEKRYAVLAHMIVQLPKHVLDPKIGGKVIELEKQYMDLF